MRRRGGWRGVQGMIAEIISKEKNGCTAAEVLYSLESIEGFITSYEVVTVTLSRMSKNGLIYTQGKERCDHCASLRLRYYLTNDGLIYLNS